MSGPGSLSALGQLRAVLGKEARDAVRDRRSVLSALLYPLFGPVMLAVMFSALAERQSGERPLVLPTSGAETAPHLVAWLEERGATVEPFEGDALAAVRSREADLVLVIDEDWAEDFESGEPARVELVHDGSRDDVQPLVRRARDLLRDYGETISTLRLLARGIDPAITVPVRVDTLDLATSAQLSARLFSMLPMFLVLAAFVASLNIAIDATAGERERLSLEPLLVNPVSRPVLVAGKWLVAASFSVVGVLLTLPFFLIAMRRVPLEELGVQLALGPDQLALMVLILTPMAALASALQMTVATFARSFKEAQTYVNLLTFVPMIPGIAATIYPIDTAPWMAFVPALSQQQLLLDVMGGERPGWALILGSAVVTLALAGALLALTARLLQSERIVFGR